MPGVELALSTGDVFLIAIIVAIPLALRPRSTSRPRSSGCSTIARHRHSPGTPGFARRCDSSSWPATSGASERERTRWTSRPRSSVSFASSRISASETPRTSQCPRFAAAFGRPARTRSQRSCFGYTSGLRQCSKRRDEVLETFQTHYHAGARGSVSGTALEQGDDEEDEGELGQEPGRED